MGKPLSVRAEVRRKIETAVMELLLQDEVPSGERFKGVILLMRAHGLPCEPEQVAKIRKYWDACVDDRKRRSKKR